MTDAEIDRIILRHWPIDSAMAGKVPTFDTLRAMVREARYETLEQTAKALDELPVGSFEGAAEHVRSLKVQP